MVLCEVHEGFLGGYGEGVTDCQSLRSEITVSRWRKEGTWAYRCGKQYRNLKLILIGGYLNRSVTVRELAHRNTSLGCKDCIQNAIFLYAEFEYR
jgi:hypothetical protein